jgi:hypothetical protein
MREWCGVTLVLGLGCASSAGLPVEAPDLAPQVVVPEPSRLSWQSVWVAGVRVCGTDERGIEWCWHAADLDAEPLAVYQLLRARVRFETRVRFDARGRQHLSIEARTPIISCTFGRDPLDLLPLWPRRCGRSETGEVNCSSSDSIEACSLHASGHVYCRSQGSVQGIEGVEDAAGLVMNDEAACTLSSEGRAWCWASGASEAVELSVPADEPSVELTLFFNQFTGLLEMSPQLFAPLRLQLHDRFDPLFGPEELSFGIPKLVLTRANRA